MTALSTSSALVPADRQALALGFPGSLGNLDAYISSVNRLPMLTITKVITVKIPLK